MPAISRRPSHRPSHRAGLALICVALLLTATLADARYLRVARDAALVQTRALVAALQLTDLCLFTEARYTRHLSQADRHAAFADHPYGLDHFPSGSLVPPPAHLTAADERLDRQTAVSD